MVNTRWSILIMVALTLVASGCRNAKMEIVKRKARTFADLAPPEDRATPEHEVPETDESDTHPEVDGKKTADEVKAPGQAIVADPDRGTQMILPEQGPILEFRPNREEPIATEAEAATPATADETCGEGTSCAPIYPKAGQCSGSYPIAGNKDQRPLDVVFVVDTSVSLRGGKNNKTGGELALIARQMENFVKTLDDTTDLRIGVMLGHGAAPWHGRLFKGYGPAVLDLTKMTNETGSRAAGVKKMWQTLEKKMLAVPSDPDKTAQGEAMLLSLYHAVTNSTNLAEIKSQGLLRDEAGLLVVLVSDEQDVCFTYAGTKFQPVLKKYPNEATEIPDRGETEFYNRVCAVEIDGRGGKKKPLYPEHVNDALKAVKGGTERLFISAIAYTDLNTMPPARPENQDENEIGHGLLDLVTLNHGKPIDLASAGQGSEQSFAEILKQLGKFAKSKLMYTNVHQCRTRGIHPASINLFDVQLEILNSQGEHVATYSSSCRNGKACENQAYDGPLKAYYQEKYAKNGVQYMEVAIDPETLNAKLGGLGLEKAEAKIRFKIRPDINPFTGDKL